MLELFLTQVWRNDKGFNINVKLNEGKYYSDVNFIKNTSYSTEVLQKLLGYRKEKSMMQ